ncbi:MAG TPA: hypothetical protein VMU50_19555 [Polyangia bacterium]|nr:hypothetical protein [Polyangia bacterium]
MNPRPLRLRLPFLIALVAGCLAPSQRREEGLTKAAVEYNNELRWGRYEHMDRFLSKDESAALVVRGRDLGDDFSIAENELALVQIAPGAEKATVVTEVAWYNQRRALLNKSTIEQHWQWNDGRWMLADQRRIHGSRFPLVPEPLAKAPVPAAAAAAAASVPPATPEARR